MSRPFKAIVAVLNLALAMGFAIAYLPELHSSATHVYRLAAGFGGFADAQYALGYMYAGGQGVPLDYKAAASWYRKAADQGNASAQYELAFMYANGQGVLLDVAVAVSWYRKAADQGFANAQYELAFMYANGQGVPQDYKAAASWYRKAADQGNASAQYELAFMYANGQGVPLDYKAAASWYRKAADQGNASAQYELAFMYADGQGVLLDVAVAVSWYRKAADQGFANAQYELAFMYANGQGVPQDYEAAASWYRKAADQGFANAQYELGFMYANGQGVPQDYVIAHMWFNLAAIGEDVTGYIPSKPIVAANIIAAKMTPAQIAEARKRAAEWRPKMANAAPTQAPQGDGEWVTVGLVPMKMDSGIFVVPVQINGTITLDFVIDSGASDVSVPADVFSTLKRAGTIRESDFIGQQTYVLADGSKSQSATFTIRSLRVGDMVVENVRGRVASSQGSLLLGQSFLERFKSWSIDNTKHELLLEPR